MKNAGTIRDFIQQLAAACEGLKGDIFTIAEFVLFVVALGFVVGAAVRLHSAGLKRRPRTKMKRASRLKG